MERHNTENTGDRVNETENIEKKQIKKENGTEAKSTEIIAESFPKLMEKEQSINSRNPINPKQNKQTHQNKQDNQAQPNNTVEGERGKIKKTLKEARGKKPKTTFKGNRATGKPEENK